MNPVFLEAKKLINSNGNVCVWKSETMDGVRRFLTEADAKKYIEWHHQFCREKGREDESYSIGTEADFMAAAQKFERKKKANEVKEYCKHVGNLIECKQREIKALDGLAEVCRQFDGKVLNKRFHDAVTKATGFYSSFGANWFDFFEPGYNIEFRASAGFPVDWSHGINRYTGKKKDMNPRDWHWYTGDRLEAEKAIAVIEHHKNDRLTTIENLEASKKKYAAYLRLARKAEAIMKEMEGYDYEIRQYAKEKDLSQYSHHSYFWKGY